MLFSKDLLNFLKPYNKDIQKLALDLMEYVWTEVPEANMLIWDNYNAVAVAFAKSEKLSDAFCHVAVYAKHVNLGFNRGAELNTKHVVLKGGGKLIRHITCKGIEDFDTPAIQELILQASLHADTINPELKDSDTQGIAKVMSIAEKKIRPSEN